MTKLRVGLLADGMSVPAWAFRMIERIVASEYASVELVVLDESVSPLKRPRGGWRTIPGGIVRRVLERSYAYLVRKQVARPDAMAPCDATPLLEGVPVMRVRPIRKRFSDVFEDTAVDAIEEHLHKLVSEIRQTAGQATSAEHQALVSETSPGVETAT